MNEKLKPCPLCGNIHVKIDQGEVVCSIHCGTKMRIMPTESAEDGIRRWNTRPAEKILPVPCTHFNESSVKDWLQKINGDLDEFKEAVLHTVTLTGGVSGIQPWNRIRVAEKAADVITAITSMLEAMEIDEDMRQKAQQQVNAKNKECGYCE